MTEQPGAVLGHDRLDVDRQRDADRAQPAADRLWVKLLTRAVPFLLFPAIMAFCWIGVYRVNNNAFDVYAGRASSAWSATCWSSCGCEPAPLLLGFVLGPMMEENLRRAMILSRGDPTIFVDAADQRRAARHGAGRHRGGVPAGDHQVARKGDCLAEQLIVLAVENDLSSEMDQDWMPSAQRENG